MKTPDEYLKEHDHLILRLARAIGSKTVNGKALVEDMAQVGRMALWQRVGGFDATTGNCFWTYVYPYVKYAMYDHLRDSMPSGLRRVATGMMRHKLEARANKGDAEAKRILSHADAQYRDVSFDRLSDHGQPKDVIHDQTHFLDHLMVKDQADILLAQLSDSEYEVVKEVTLKQKSHEEAADHLNVSRSYTFYMMSQAKKTMKERKGRLVKIKSSKRGLNMSL